MPRLIRASPNLTAWRTSAGADVHVPALPRHRLGRSAPRWFVDLLLRGGTPRLTATARSARSRPWADRAGDYPADVTAELFLAAAEAVAPLLRAPEPAARCAC